MSSHRNRAQKLRSEIEELRYKYHVLNDPGVSDEVYTSLTHELKQLEDEHPELHDPNSPTQRVGTQVLDKFVSRVHSRPMLSLNDVFSSGELETWMTRIGRLLDDEIESQYHLDLKLDGLAAALVYENGQLDYALTRGDGFRGEDITFNLRTIESVPLRLRRHADIPESIHSSRIEIRGEIVIYNSNFEKLNAEREERGEQIFANPRNLAAGSVRQLDPKLAAARPLRFHAYRVLGEAAPDNLYEEYELAKKLGFIINDMHTTAGSSREIMGFIDQWDERRHQLDFRTDGVVVVVNQNDIFESLGVVGKAPRGAAAYKYAAEQATTRVRDILVNVGRTGAVTPFAVMDPVHIAGSTVQMATLHNEGEIKRKDIRIGDTVVVQKAGDIIPEVVEPLPKLRDGSEKVFEMPKNCPDCGHALHKKMEEAVWRCINQNCPAQSRGKIEHFASKDAFDIEGLGERIVAVLLEKNLARDPADLYALKTEDLEKIERFGEKSAQNLIEAIQARKQAPLDRYIYALGIRHVGRQTAIDLAQHFGSLEAIEKASPDELNNVEGVGTVVAEAIAGWFSDPENQELLRKLHDHGVKPKGRPQTGGKLAGKTFVITGTLESMSRDEAADKIRAQGGKVQASVSKNTDYLVVGDKPGGSKIVQAEQFGTKQLTESGLKKLLET